ncbi:MAG: MJ0042-type zinc finger domain-containing protein [Gemmataceae bacterium]
MPIIVACPSCSGKLRVADDLLGSKVRCPACNATFDAVAPAAVPPAPPPPPAPAPPRDEPIPTETVAPWRMLDLELAAETKPPADPTPASPLRGAVEVDDGGRPAPPRQDDPAPARKRPAARLNDDHDDLRRCPECGRMNHLDSRWCSYCDVELIDDTRRPSRRDRGDRGDRRRVRRDCEPHRGGFILAMGIISLAVLFACWPLAPLAVVPGLIAWVLGHADLRKIRDGVMDPDGEGSTQAGWVCGIIGTCLNLLVLLGCGTVFGTMWWSEVQRSRTFNRPPMVAPPR